MSATVDHRRECAMCELPLDECECCEHCGEAPRNCDCPRAPLTITEREEVRGCLQFHEDR